MRHQNFDTHLNGRNSRPRLTFRIARNNIVCNQIFVKGIYAMSDPSLVFATATELSKLLRKKKVSSVELTRLFVERLQKLGPNYNALAELTPELALAQARKADRALSQGKATSALTGIPYGAKDLLATKGIPTRWGAPPYKDQVLDHDATVIRRMREAGAVLAGKLAMVELAGGGGYAYASASLHGPGLNPWNLKHWAGGSSSGSGSAVAAGLVPFALGSETWGSIVTPSAYCGITGLRPTWGLVSRYGAMELAWSMDKVGPMARSAEDCGWVLQAIAGFDTKDDTTIKDGFTFKPRVSRRDFHLGVLSLDYSEHPETERVFAEAVRVLRKAGMKLTRTELPNHDYEVFTRTLLNGEMAAAHKELIESGRVDELVDAPQAQGLKDSLKIPVADYVRAQQKQIGASLDLLRMFQKFDALVAPTLLIEAPTLDTNLRTAFKKRGGHSVLGATAGVPCLTVPMGFGPMGLPLGLCITGNLFDEQTILEIGMVFQRESDWHTKHPGERNA
jgi:aspartyl-tRNA(Asn)/glutamyl-tRNA(Gln) amidotransferase subunit A